MQQLTKIKKTIHLKLGSECKYFRDTGMSVFSRDGIVACLIICGLFATFAITPVSANPSDTTDIMPDFYPKLVLAKLLKTGADIPLAIADSLVPPAIMISNMAWGTHIDPALLNEVYAGVQKDIIQFIPEASVLYEREAGKGNTMKLLPLVANTKNPLSILRTAVLAGFDIDLGKTLKEAGRTVGTELLEEGFDTLSENGLTNHPIVESADPVPQLFDENSVRSDDPILGYWKATNPPDGITEIGMIFYGDGTGSITVNTGDILIDLFSTAFVVWDRVSDTEYLIRFEDDYIDDTTARPLTISKDESNITFDGVYFVRSYP